MFDKIITDNCFHSIPSTFHFMRFRDFQWPVQSAHTQVKADVAAGLPRTVQECSNIRTNNWTCSVTIGELYQSDVFNESRNLHL